MSFILQLVTGKV